MKNYGYWLDGSLDSNHPTYVLRKADEELPEILRKSPTCSILTSKQMGKSNVAKRATQELENKDDNIICLTVNIQIISEKNNEKIWYQSFMYHVVAQNSKISNLKDSLDEERENLKSEELDDSTKLGKFLNKILELTEKKHLILIIDEIDELIDITFNTDSLLNYIRSCHQNYQPNAFNSSQINRITFCLIGTGTPNDFIKDKYRRSFNVGEKIELRGLEFNQYAIDKLSRGLKEKFKDETFAKLILEEIFNWTNGQPFLTQLICALMCNVTKDSDTENDVKRFVKDCIDKNIQPCLRTYPELRDWIENRIKKYQTIRLLERYKEILEKGEITADPNYNYEDMQLRLSGLVITTKDGNSLQPFNRIYEKIFGLDWVNTQLGNLIPYSEKFEAWRIADDKIRQRYLLYGNDLKNARNWAEGKSISTEYSIFLEKSESFLIRVKDNFPNNSDYEEITNAIFSLTGGVKFLIDWIFSKVDKRYKTILKEDAETWFEREFNLMSKLKNEQEPQEHFKTISDRLLNDPDIDPSLLLSSYQEILEQKEVEFNESRPEPQKLINMCLGVKEDGKLRIVGKIYRLIFDKKWVEEQLSRLCPYAKEFQAWQSSGCQDESLLKGEDLQTAINWIQKKEELSEPELEFIITSLVWEIWQSDSKEEKKEAVAIIHQFLPRLKEKPNYSYGLIQEILKYTRYEPSLLEGCFNLIVKNDYLVEDIENFVTGKKKTDNLIEFFKNQLIEETNNGYGIDSIFLLNINNYIFSSYLLESDSQSLDLNKIIEIGRHNIKNLLDETQTLTEELSIKHINLFTQDDKIIYFAILSVEILICVVVDIQKNQVYLNLQKIIKDNQDKITDLLTS